MRGALRKGAPFALWLTLSAPLAAAWDCGAGDYDTVERAARVVGGDSVLLLDGRTVNLLGVAVPPERSAQARESLERLLGSARLLHLRIGDQRFDDFGDLQAHAFLPDGTNLGAALLAAGSGFLHLPPSERWQLDCYAEAERSARMTGRGLWSAAAYAPMAAARLPRNAGGYAVVYAPVSRVELGPAGARLELEGGPSLVVAAADLALFRDLDLRALVGRTVTAGGWIERVGERPQLRLRHPAGLAAMPGSAHGRHP